MSEIITLIDENDVEFEFEVEAFLDVDDEKYAILIPLSVEGNDEAVVMRLGLDEDGSEVLFDIDDDEEWNRVAAAYDNFVDEEYNDFEEDAEEDEEENEEEN